MPQIGFTDTPSFYVEKLTTKTPMPAMHHHKTYELFYVVRGGREYFIEEGFYRLSEGDLVIIPKNLLHRTDGRDATRYLVYFSYDYLARFFTVETLGALSLDRPFVFRGEGAEREYLNRIFAALLSDYTGAAREKKPEDDPVLAGYLYQILFTLTNSSSCLLCGNVLGPFPKAKLTNAHSDCAGGDNDYLVSGILDIADNFTQFFYPADIHMSRGISKRAGTDLDYNSHGEPPIYCISLLYIEWSGK